jgi:DNA repair ATPase RecN
MSEIIRPTGICTICWENSTNGSKYGDVCGKCLPLTKSVKENEMDNLKISKDKLKEIEGVYIPSNDDKYLISLAKELISTVEEQQNKLNHFMKDSETKQEIIYKLQRKLENAEKWNKNYEAKIDELMERKTLVNEAKENIQLALETIRRDDHDDALNNAMDCLNCVLLEFVKNEGL